MKYFIDTEFKEYFKQHKLLGIPVGYKTPTIDLISIGIIAEDGREFYALNKECDIKEVWGDEWLRCNVLLSIYQSSLSGDIKNRVDFSYQGMKYVFELRGKTKNEITQGIKSFINGSKGNDVDLNKVIESITKCDCWNEKYYPKEFEYIKIHNTHIPDATYGSGDDGKGVKRNKSIIYNQPDFYAYYASYDWVVFCQLFGRMLDLPKGFPMYCKDLKQMMDDKGLDKDWKRKNCPDPEGEHNALIDAKWNKNLYDLLINHKA